MPYVVPTFNLSAGIWSFGVGPPFIPRLIVDCQLRYNPLTTFYPVALLPKLTDVRDSWSTNNEDVMEIPLGSGRLYNVYIVEDIAKGFTNEHRAATLYKNGNWPIPIP